MKRARVLQLIGLIVLFLISCALFLNSSNQPESSNSEYVPPSP